jgi:hypothetical protein
MVEKYKSMFENTNFIRIYKTRKKQRIVMKIAISVK